jgi:TatD DNase family protein
MLYDTHSHPYLLKEKSQDETLSQFFSQENTILNCIGIDLVSSQTALSLAQQYLRAYASIWIHPCSIYDDSWSLEEKILMLEKIYEKNKQKIVAIGEIGLDTYWLEKMSWELGKSQDEIFETQKIYFRRQIQLAKKLLIPFIIHSREAGNEVFEILKDEKYNNFVLHSFAEDLGYALSILNIFPEAKLSFSWIITFNSAKEIQETAANIPLKNILIETDSPFLTPAPYRWKQENEPLFCQYVLSKIIDLRNEESENITRSIYQNSRDFFWV